ncbi:YdhR family protein [Streptomyces sp. JJ36]|uniref:YdhR family protein n=1 Tax=Streptomyces sp. JJ36 TaxID=2736645 RepID=UPI001F44E69C|nr:YdhR family protein [Streptomyces sp. JJ36]
MKAVVAWWDLPGPDSGRTVAALRGFLRNEAVPRFAEFPGLRLKFWISDAERGRWGAVFLWESEAAARQPLPTRAAEILGSPPTSVHRFDVEAAVEGVHTTPDLTGLGLAFAAAGGAAQYGATGGAAGAPAPAAAPPPGGDGPGGGRAADAGTTHIPELFPF